MAADLQKFIDFVDANTSDPSTSPFIDRLKEIVKIPSISDETIENGVRKYPIENVKEAGEWVKTKLQEVGVTDIWDVQADYDPENKRAPLVVGTFGSKTDLKTVLIYSHYDVQPADPDGWKAQNPDSQDPFNPTLLPQGTPTKLVGRGTTDDKGPITAWLNVFQGHYKPGETGTDRPTLPVNIRFLFEGEEEVGGPGLDAWIAKESQQKDKFFTGIDYVAVTDNYWLTTRKPTLTFGVRGIATFSIQVTGAKDDLHSGIYGRMVHEPLVDLVKLLAALVETNGTITIPGVEELVDPLTDEERQQYDNIDYSVEDLVRDTGTHVELSQNPAKLLLGRMRFPSLSLHGIDGGREGPIIPRQVTGRFSIRLVNSQTAQKVVSIVKDFIYDQFDKLGSRNLLTVSSDTAADPWVGENVDNDVNFKAAAAASEDVYGQFLQGREPDLTREGGSIPLLKSLEGVLEKNGSNKSILLLPMGKSDDGAHSLSEKLDVENYVGGTKLYAAYLYRLAAFTQGGN